ncbi:MAG: hypothetical protein II583_03285 [Oscillospiraceae bacterium]|nr:hypothetical protein [Oscillospiraceae bacterium]
MKTVDVYRQYFKAACTFNEVPRRGALVTLTAESDAGTIKYTAGVSFFPHVDDEDYAVAYDAYCERELFFGKGRRSKKRDAEYLELLQTVIDEEAEKIGGRVFWDEPLREAQMG